MQQSYTQDLAHWAMTADLARIDLAVRKEAVRTLINWIGCAIGGADNFGKLVIIWRTLLLDQGRHIGIRLDYVREDRDQLVLVAHHAAVADIEIDAADEFAV